MATKSYDSKTDDYMTDKEIYQPVLNFIEVDKFDLDVCCSQANIPADIYNFQDGQYYLNKWRQIKKRAGQYNFYHKCGLKSNWFGICFMNPPWSKTKIWLEKAFAEVKENNCEVWCVLPGDRLNQIYFNKLLRENNNWFIAALQGRFNFYNPHISEEENENNKKNGGFGKPIFILYIGKRTYGYSKKWHDEQPIKSVVLKGC